MLMGMGVGVGVGACIGVGMGMGMGMRHARVGMAPTQSNKSRAFLKCGAALCLSIY